MNASKSEDPKRWFRVSSKTDRYRFVDVCAACEDDAQVIAEDLDDLVWMEIDDDDDWIITDVKPIAPDNVWHPMM